MFKLNVLQIFMIQRVQKLIDTIMLHVTKYQNYYLWSVVACEVGNNKITLHHRDMYSATDP